MMNKKGNAIAIILIVGGLFLLVFFGLFLALGSSVINYVMDTVVPELSGLGVIGEPDGTNFNATEIVDITITPVNTLIQNFTWVAGILYMFGIMGIFGIAFVFRNSGEKWLIGLFFGLVLLLIIATIFVSNIYEEFFTGTDEIALILKEHVLLSYLVIYSPAIMSLVSFIAGIILFSGDSEGFV